MKREGSQLDDSFWETWEPIMFTKERLLAIPEAVDNIISLLNAKPEMKVLDLCCGVGQHSLEFARRGYIVVGIDTTQMYLDHAERDADKENLQIEFICEDMRSFKYENSFDIIINMSSSFGFFEDNNDQMLVLENIYSSLKSGGFVIFDMTGKELIARDFVHRVWKSGEYGYALYEDIPIDDWSKMKHRWTYISKDGVVKTWESTSYIYSAEELKMMLNETGFKNIQVFGNLKGAEYDHKAQRLVAIGRK
jgi:SAM-dependent methyltransferase